MNTQLDILQLAPLQAALNAHPVYAALRDLADLRCFMEHHIYAVWDFMSLLKCVQQHVAPARVPWLPRGNRAVQHFINTLVLEEESDAGLTDAGGNPIYASHFELYCRAMEEVGAGTDTVQRFVSMVAEHGIRAALAADLAPEPSRRFMEATFHCIDSDKPHLAAAALALGREQVIPGMFRAALERMQIIESQAPAFHLYLRRHILLDGDVHGPLSLQMVNELCAGRPERILEAMEAAHVAIGARLGFWDGVHAAILGSA